MSRLLGLALAVALSGAAWAVTPVTIVNNAAYTVLSTDVRVVTGPTAFTASRTWTLPFANQTCIGQSCAPGVNALDIIDSGNAVSLASPLVIAPASGNTINGSSSSLTISAAGMRVTLTPVSASNWAATFSQPSQVSMGGTVPTVFHSGGVSLVAAATGTDVTASATTTYIVEVDVLNKATLTGVSCMGMTTGAGNLQFSLADSTGKIITAAQTASTANAAAAAFQQVAFTTPYVALPGKYFILQQNDTGTSHFRAHTVGNFGASSKTGETYGTFTNITPPTTFTTAVGPICDTY